MSLVERVIEVHRHLDACGLPHAFGGALALAYIADPRGTVDIDVNVFVPYEDVAVILDALGAIGYHRERPADDAIPVSGIRFRRSGDPVPLDVFPSLDPGYDEIERRSTELPFGPDEVPLPFLSAEDLTVFKLSFGRAKDWVDLRNIVDARPSLDLAYVERQLIAFRGPHMHPRLARLRVIARGAG